MQPTPTPAPKPRYGVGIRFAYKLLELNQPGQWYRWPEPIPSNGTITPRVQRFCREHGITMIAQREPDVDGQIRVWLKGVLNR